MEGIEGLCSSGSSSRTLATFLAWPAWPRYRPEPSLNLEGRDGPLENLDRAQL